MSLAGKAHPINIKLKSGQIIEIEFDRPSSPAADTTLFFQALYGKSAIEFINELIAKNTVLDN